ncbi:MAG: hypothetical protein IPL91_15095 [Hyphomicrobium sp.]|nr:hypothetical protein [Hyphomicrobium sp.]
MNERERHHEGSNRGITAAKACVAFLVVVIVLLLVLVAILSLVKTVLFR